MKEKNMNLKYSTSDLATATFLFTIGHKLLTTSILNAKKLIFHFEHTANIEEDAARFLHGAEAPAKKLFENYRTLRAITFEKINMNGRKT